MSVKGDAGHERRTQAHRRAATRAALIDAGRALFAEQGYADTGREEIVERAGVTRGAMYHHFAGKQDLFQAVYEAVEADLCAAVMVAATAAAAEPREMLRIGALAYLEAAADPAVARILIRDAPSVLPPETLDRLAEQYGLGLVRGALAEAMQSGSLTPQPLDPLARLVMSLLHEAAKLTAEATTKQAKADIQRVLEGFLQAL